MRLPYSLVLLAGATLSAQAPTPADWPVYGGGPESMRYSALQQITRQNVTHLKVAWTFDASDGIPSSELEVNPIVVSGVLYATTVRLTTVALKAATGELLWRFDPYRGRRWSHTRSRPLGRWPGPADLRRGATVSLCLGRHDGTPHSVVRQGRANRHAGRPTARREADGLARDARDRLQEPAHHRQPDAGEPPDAAGRRAGVRRENRGVALDLPHDSPARRVRVRNLAERRVDVFRRRQ